MRITGSIIIASSHDTAENTESSIRSNTPRSGPVDNRLDSHVHFIYSLERLFCISVIIYLFKVKIMPELIPIETITRKIYIIRNLKIITDKDLAKLYGVETIVLNQAFTRNVDRFPSDFMFELTRE